MKRARLIRNGLSFKEVLEQEIKTEIDGIQNFCVVLGKPFATTGIVSCESLYNNRQFKALRKHSTIPYEKMIRCIYDNQNYYYMMSQINQYT